MGCDIHCYIEYKKPDRDGWSDFGGRINPGRLYQMFGALAGVRSRTVNFLQPRGVPNDMSYASKNDYWLFIVENNTDESGFCTVEQAKRYIASGSILKNPTEPFLHNSVSHPDWHSHSWVTPDEFEQAIAVHLKANGFQINTARLPAPQELSALTTTDENSNNWALSELTEYWAILAAMRCFEQQGFQSRLVFWFDN